MSGTKMGNIILPYIKDRALHFTKPYLYKGVSFYIVCQSSPISSISKMAWVQSSLVQWPQFCIHI